MVIDHQFFFIHQALTLMNKMRNYWNVIKVGFPLYVNYVSIAFTFTNLLVQQVVAITTQHYCYESRYAWAAFGASCFHLLGAGSAYIVNKNKLQMFSFLIALILLGLAIFSITFEQDYTVPAFYLSHLLQLAYRLSGLIRKYYLLLDGLTVPLSRVSKGDARIKFKVNEEDSHFLNLDMDSWFEVREDFADLVKFEPDVRHEVILSVFSIEENVISFVPRNYRAQAIPRAQATDSKKEY